MMIGGLKAASAAQEDETRASEVDDDEEISSGGDVVALRRARFFGFGLVSAIGERAGWVWEETGEMRTSD